MKLRIILLSLALTPLMGCGPTVTAPPAPLGPGYISSADQTLGQSLAALNGFVMQEKINYAQLSMAQQTPEKPFLNALIDSVNVANAAYMAFHAGTGTLVQAQTAVVNAQTAQSALAAKKVGK